MVLDLEFVGYTYIAQYSESVFNIGLASPGALCAALGCQGLRMHPEGGNSAGEGAGRNCLWGVIEDSGLVCFREKEAEG